MTDETLHDIDFHDADEYHNENVPESIYHVQASSQLPAPNIGETVSFGWFEEDGERVGRVHYNAMNNNEADYVRSQEYTVVDVKRHYHHAIKHNDRGKVVTNRIEVGTDVLVRPREDSEEAPGSHNE